LAISGFGGSWTSDSSDSAEWQRQGEIISFKNYSNYSQVQVQVSKEISYQKELTLGGEQEYLLGFIRYLRNI